MVALEYAEGLPFVPCTTSFPTAWLISVFLVAFRMVVLVAPAQVELVRGGAPMQLVNATQSQPSASNDSLG